MPGIRLILIYVFFTAISQDVLVQSRRNPARCRNNEYSCLSGDQCIPRSFQCDGESDCQDESDEMDCNREDAVQPYGETPNLQNSYAQRNQEEEFCLYDYENSLVKVRIGRRTLRKGDKIMRGETITIECRYPSMVMAWENGLRYYGRAKMTCRSCETWKSPDFPSCKLDRRVDAVIGQEEDLEVLPGGTVQIQKGESRQFFCSYFRKTVQWTNEEKRGVSVTKTEDRTDRKIIYIAYLDITQAEEGHSGRYECYTRRPGVGHIWSTYLDLQVVEKLVTSPGNGVTTPRYPVFPRGEGGPREVPRGSPRGGPRDGPREGPREDPRECFCVYDSGDIFVTAKIGDKKLKRGDTIMSGETATFECESTRILSWENNMRYFGTAHMTCNKCKVWSGADLPTCSIFSKNEVYISSLEDLTFLPGAIVYMKKGESNEFRCVGANSPPKWKHEAIVPVTERRSRLRHSSDILHTAHLKITQAKREHTGIYDCISQDSGTTTMHLQVDDLVSCSKHPVYPGVQVTYSKGVFVGSVATFSCSSSSKTLFGSPLSVCLERGTWSSRVPTCEDLTCSTDDLEKALPENIEIDWDNSDEENVDDFFPPGSEVLLKCAQSAIAGNSKAVCGKDGQWKLGTLRCAPGCVLDLDPTSKLEVDPIEESYSMGQSIFLSCPRHYMLSSKVDRMICMSGRWSENLPECVKRL